MYGIVEWNYGLCLAATRADTTMIYIHTYVLIL